MRRSLSLPALGFLLVVGVHLPLTAADQKDAGTVPKEVRDLAGTYTGSWVMFGIDGQGAVVKKMSWTDTMTASGPAVKGDRAQVTTTDEMTFEGGKIPPFKIQGKEGYFLNKTGGLGDYFIEAAGQTHRMVKVGDNVWSYTAPASAEELTRLGFPKEAKGQHVLVKVVGKEREVEVHRISRLTTVQWTDQTGKERVLQFVSLQGHHKRQT